MSIKRKQNMYYTQLDYVKILIEDGNKEEARTNLKKVLDSLDSELNEVKINQTNETEKELNR